MNASLLDTRISESRSHIQTHLIMNITIACCFPHPGSVTYTLGRNREWAAWHMTTMHIVVRQDFHFQPCHILMFDSHR